MKIEVGKSYWTVKGEKADVAERHPDSGRRFPFRGVSGGGVLWWDENGNSLIDGGHDLVAEWTDDGPTRTVTRLEVVPGVYDGVSVMIPDNGMVNLHVMFAFNDPSADELEAAAAVLTELAKAVRDGQ